MVADLAGWIAVPPSAPTEAVALTARVVATILVVDFLSGIVHWLEDSYGHPDLPFVGRRVTTSNLLHHYRPRAFVTNSWYRSSELLLAACGIALVIAYALDRLTPMVVLAAVLGANANQVHKFSHRTPRENGALVSWLQRARLLQSPEQHRRHHSGESDSAYCVLTNVLNPVLDRLRFWRGLEFLVEKGLRLRKRDDASLLAQLRARQPQLFE